MITTDLKRLLKWLPVMLFPLLILSCSDPDEEPAPDEELNAWTPEQIAHSTLVGNFFNLIGTDANGNVYSPSKGIAIDEAKPSERSEACDSYEKALEKFECALPTGKNDERYIHRADNGITVDLGNLGSVKFSAASGDGVVAKADIKLKDAPNYTLLYRNEESFGDNYSSDENLYDFFHPGDLVQFSCPETVISNYYKGEGTETGDEEAKLWQWGICTILDQGLYPPGIVIEATAHSVSVLTTHAHYYSKYDEKKNFTRMYYKLISAEGWRRVYNSWHHNMGPFLDTYNKNKSNSVISRLRHVMDGTTEDTRDIRYVVVEGTDFERKLKKKCWYSWQKRIKVSDLRNGNFTTEYVPYALKDEVDDLYCYMFSLIEFNRAQAEHLEVIYPKY